MLMVEIIIRYFSLYAFLQTSYLYACEDGHSVLKTVSILKPNTNEGLKRKEQFM